MMMRTITAMEFLQIDPSERLRYVTVGNITSDDVKTGSITALEINFSFQERFNRQLYLHTTAGMILPDEVRSVVVDGVEYQRDPHARKGEFFQQNGSRLIIRDETKIQIQTLLSSEQLDQLFSGEALDQKYSGYEREIAQEAQRRGMPIGVALTLFSDTV